MISKVDVIQIKKLMEINDITMNNLSVESDLDIKTIERIFKEGTLTLKSIIKISKVLKCNITDIMLKS